MQPLEIGEERTGLSEIAQDLPFDFTPRTRLAPDFFPRPGIVTSVDQKSNVRLNRANRGFVMPVTRFQSLI